MKKVKAGVHHLFFISHPSFFIPSFGRVAQSGQSVRLTSGGAKVQILPRPLRSGVAKLARQRIVNAPTGGSNPPARAKFSRWRGVNGREHARPVSERCGFDSRRHLPYSHIGASAQAGRTRLRGSWSKEALAD